MKILTITFCVLFAAAGIGMSILHEYGQDNNSTALPDEIVSAEYAYQELNPSPRSGGTYNIPDLKNQLLSFVSPDRLFAEDMTAPYPVEKRIVRAEPSKYREAVGAHDGAGSMNYMSVFDHTAFETNWLFIHRGVLNPGGGIGEHIHRNMEEMYFIFDHESQFTINGRTAVLPGGCCVACNCGQSHAIYNHTDKTVEWMNLAVAMEKGVYDAVNYGDDRIGAKLESPAPFGVAYIDDRLIQWVERAHDGKGKLGFRRLYSHESFKTNWGFIDHCVLPPGTSIGYHRHDWMEECYMVITGSGRATLDGQTFDVQAGDFILNRLHGDHGIYNNGDEDMLLINMCVSLEKGKFDATNHGDDLSTK